MNSTTARMTYVRTAYQMLVMGCLSLAMSGCASLGAQRMVPPSQVSGASSNAGVSASSGTGRSVGVIEVQGGTKPRFGGAAVLNDKIFKEALTEALKKSELFTTVGGRSGAGGTGGGDLKLRATIKSQGQRVSRGLQYTALMVVNYEFTGTDGRSVWSETYESEFSAVNFSGAARTVRAREGAARENLAVMLQGIREHWPKGN